MYKAKGNWIVWGFVVAPLLLATLNLSQLSLNNIPYNQLDRDSEHSWEIKGYAFYAAVRNLYRGRSLVLVVPDRVSEKHLSRLTGLPVTVGALPPGATVNEALLGKRRSFAVEYEPSAEVPIDLVDISIGKVAKAVLVYPVEQTSRIYIAAVGEKIVAIPDELLEH